MEYDKIKLQKELTKALNKEFIVSEQIQNEIDIFSDLFSSIISKYPTYDTKLKYNQNEFVSQIDKVYYSWLNKPDIDTFKTCENFQYYKAKVYSLREHRIYSIRNENGNDYHYHSEDQYFDESHYHNEIRILDSFDIMYDNLLEERNMNIGKWKDLTLTDFISFELEEIFRKNELSINPPLGNFIDDDILNSIRSFRYDYPYYHYTTDRLALENYIDSYTNSLLPAIITKLKSKTNPDIDNLLKKTISYLRSETSDLNTKIYLNIGTKHTVDRSSSRYSSSFYDQYEFRIAETDYVIHKNVDVESPPTKIVNIHLINNKTITRILVSPEKLLSRSEQLIKKDVKKLEVVNDSILEIHYHGHHSPDSIVFDNYTDAINLQKFILDNR